MFNTQVLNFIQERKNIDDNDPALYDFWQRFSNHLGRREKQTIEYLENCTSADILCISEVFEEISALLQSKEYIRCLDKLVVKFPELNLEHSVNAAKDFLNSTDK